MALSHSPVSLNPGAVEGSVGVIVGSNMVLVISISAVVPSPVKCDIPTEFVIPSRVDDASAVCIGAAITYIAQSERHRIPCDL